MAGSEQVLDAMLECYPGSPVFALVDDPAAFDPGSYIARAEVRTSFIQRLPKATTAYRLYLPFMPFAVEQFDLDGFEVVVSNVKAVAHGALTGPGQLHVAYVNRPMRYAWDLYHQEVRDFGRRSRVKGPLARIILHYLRLWDREAMQRPDVLATNSRTVQALVWKYYRRDTEVIHPPVNVDSFSPSRDRADYFVSVARLVPYKRVDVVVRAFNELGLPLKVIGDGPLEDRLRALAKPNVEFLGWIPTIEVRRHLERARALVFAADEEFGIAPVEAQAAGAPVIAYGKGGATETVVEGETGILFPAQSPASLAEAVRAFVSGRYRFRVEAIRTNAERFSRQRFQERFSSFLDRSLESFVNGSGRSG